MRGRLRAASRARRRHASWRREGRGCPRGATRRRGDLAARRAGASRQPLGLLLDPLGLRRPRGRGAAPPRSRRSSRAIPEYGDRRKAYSSRRPPPAQANWSSESSACPSGVVGNLAGDSIPNGISSTANTVSSGSRQRSIVGNDHGDLLGGGAGPKLGEDVVADELDRPAQAGTGEEADGSGDRLRRRRPGLEERALEPGERRRGELRGTGRQLLDSSRGERGKVVRGTCERGERRRGRARRAGRRGRRSGRRAPRAATTRPRSDPRSHRRRRALRARTTRSPRSRSQALRRSRSRSQRPGPVELVPVRGEERAELAVEVGRVEQPAFEVRERAEQRVGESREPRRGFQALPRSARGRPGPPRGRAAPATPRACGPGRRRRSARTGRRTSRSTRRTGTRLVEQVALDPGDVRPVRHDQERLVFQARQIALEQERDLTRIRGPDDEIQSQSSPSRPGAMVDSAPRRRASAAARRGRSMHVSRRIAA